MSIVCHGSYITKWIQLWHSEFLAQKEEMFAPGRRVRAPGWRGGCGDRPAAQASGWWGDGGGRPAQAPGRRGGARRRASGPCAGVEAAGFRQAGSGGGRPAAAAGGRSEEIEDALAGKAPRFPAAMPLSRSLGLLMGPRGGSCPRGQSWTKGWFP